MYRARFITGVGEQLLPDEVARTGWARGLGRRRPAPVLGRGGRVPSRGDDRGAGQTQRVPHAIMTLEGIKRLTIDQSLQRTALKAHCLNSTRPKATAYFVFEQRLL